MPLAATMPNSAMPAPPSTGCGMPSTIAPIFGSQTEQDQHAAGEGGHVAAATPVIDTRPTFCANAVYGNVLKTPPSTVDRPSARRPSASWRW